MTIWAQRTTYQGKTVNQGTRQILDAANKILASKRYGSEKEPLTLYQGSYNRGVSASAGTHDGGGAFDASAFNGKNRVKVFRLLGVAAWQREPSEGPWSRHIHGIVCGDGTAAPLAQSQVKSYYTGGTGLARGGFDRFWRPAKVPILFVLDGDLSPRTLKRTRTLLDQPYAAGVPLATVIKGSRFVPVAWVRNGYRNLWAIDAEGRCAYAGWLA